MSPSTVSRILNGTARVRDSKVRAVEAAVAKLQFMPNPVARSLAGGKSMSVGVVTQAIDSPFYGVSLAAIEKGLLRAKYSPLFVSGHWREGDERRCVDHLLSRRVEGIILLTSRLSDQELVNLARSVPLVVTGRHVDGERVYCLDFDSTMGARLATDYLIGQGHRRIAFISGPADHPDALSGSMATRRPWPPAGFRSRKSWSPPATTWRRADTRRSARCSTRGSNSPRFSQRTIRPRMARCSRCTAAASRCHRTSRGWLRRLADLGVHHPAAHHRSPVHRRDRRRRGRGDDRPDRATGSALQGFFAHTCDPRIDPTLAQLSALTGHGADSRADLGPDGSGSRANGFEPWRIVAMRQFQLRRSV